MSTKNVKPQNSINDLNKNNNKKKNYLIEKYRIEKMRDFTEPSAFPRSVFANSSSENKHLIFDMISFYCLANTLNPCLKK
jgi:hypothetical protein